MDIGTKLREARMAAQLTQERAAEALGVSRQTISNWENDRTYPDIISVIRMSDLYAVSLDRLLKEQEGATVSDYVGYLGESTDIVKGKDRLSKIVLIAVYLAIWAFALIIFWGFKSGSDAMGYSLMFLWIVLPVTTFVTSLSIGKNGFWGRWRWIAAIVLGILYMLAEYATFGTANMLAFDKFDMPEFELILVGAAISAMGIGLGTVAAHRARKRRS